MGKWLRSAVALTLTLTMGHHAKADAGTCAPSDYRALIGPIQNQGDLGWCYAFAAAGLANAFLGERVSATDISIQSAHAAYVTESEAHLQASPTADGGDITQALLIAQDHGFCADRALPDYGNRVPFEQRNTFRLIETLSATPTGAADPRAWAAHLLFPALTLADIRAEAARTKPSDLLVDLADRSCGQRIKARFKVTSLDYSKDDADKQKNISDIETGLLSGPVGIEADVSGLARFEGNTYAAHAMIVAGQARDAKDGQCRFIVRSSWGKMGPVGCVENYHLKPGDKCINGDLFLSASTLSAIVNRAVLIQPTTTP